DIPGFRKGKVPRKLIESQYGKEFFLEDAVNETFPDLYDKMIDTEELQVVERPRFSLVYAEVGVGAVVEAELTLKPTPKIVDYKGLTYKPLEISITDEEITEVIDREREKNARFIPVEDRPAQLGDITRIDYEGSVDGVPFDGGKADDAELTLGSGRFIPGFEDQVVGMNIGDERDIVVHFPAEYHAEHLAGKLAVFKVKLNAINIKEMPEFDLDFVESISDFENIEDYKTDVLKRLTDAREANAKNSKDDILARKLRKLVEVTIPDGMVESEMDQQCMDHERDLRNRGLSLEMFLQYMQMEFDAYREGYRNNVTDRLRTRFALEAIAANEGLVATDEDVDAEIRTALESYGSAADFEKVKGDMTTRVRKAMSEDIIVKKALDFVSAHAVAVDEDPDSENSEQ
ncbi:MAG: trigger factor, partial [Defluviitaleaceae bacterium]|nr:trigger factor [Defluviitaleaceae bacterium]